MTFQILLIQTLFICDDCREFILSISRYANQCNSPMLWAACCLGFLRVGEIVAPRFKSFDHRTHLCVENIAVDDANCPNVVRVSTIQSKADQL